MAAGIRYAHTNIVARDWKSLAAFYVRALGCERVPPERDLRGDWLDRATSLRGAHLRGIHLRLPGHGPSGPTLEIFQYDRMVKAVRGIINRPGLAHTAFAVRDVREALRKIERLGGGRVGEPVDAEIAGVGHIDFVYAHDPEGNIIELQRWS